MKKPKNKLSLWSRLTVIVFAGAFGLLSPAGAQVRAPAKANGPMVKLNFPSQVELKVLVDYVSQRMGIKILYDEQLATKKITIKAPGEIPASTLIGLLQSALKIQGLALIDSDQPGWKRIVENSQLPGNVPTGDAAEAIEKFGTGVAITQAFKLKNVDPTKVKTILGPFLTASGANSIAIKEMNLLIVTDYATNLLKIAKLVELLDRPLPNVVTQSVEVKNIEASAIESQINAILSARAKAQGIKERGSEVHLLPDARTNRLMIVGVRENVDEVLTLIRSLDVPLGIKTSVYTFDNVSAERMDRLIKELIDPLKVKRLYRSAVDREDNQLIVTTTPEIHLRVQNLQKQMDVPSKQVRSPVRFYKLKNVTVTEVIETLRAIEGATNPQDAANAVRPGGQIPPGPNRPPARPGQPLPRPPAVRDEGAAVEARNVLGQNRSNPLDLLLGNARVTADANTNTLIVVAQPSVQRVYADLIKTLDHRRPQVLIEVIVVVIDTTDDFSLGVEVSGGDGTGGKRLFAFSSFGLSTVDAATGGLSLLPGLGFNGTMVDSNTTDVVVRALTSHRRARVLSAPKILVNDNATGTLSSVAEVPFTSVNASSTVATTSFAGFAEAGTTITVTPHISQGDHLQLEFQVTVNNFTGIGTDGVPPPRQSDTIDSKVTIPDGHTIIVGGLNRTNLSRAQTSLPWIEHIPLLKHLASSQIVAEQRSSLFVFIRPIILREDKFKGLKFLSDRDSLRAKMPSQYPVSLPLIVQ